MFWGALFGLIFPVTTWHAAGGLNKRHPEHF